MRRPVSLLAVISMTCSLLIAVALAGGVAAAPLGEYADRVTATVLRTSPGAVTHDGGNTFTVTARYTNTGADPIDDLSYRFQRGAELVGAEAIRAEAADPGQPTAVIGTEFTDLPRALAPGESAVFATRVDLTGSASSLQVSKPGVYPVMVNLNGTVHTPAGPAIARVGELHLLLTVLSVPGEGTGEPAVPVPTQLLWPLTDRPHLSVGGVFSDDELAASIAPGGRLDRLVDALAGTRELSAGRGLVSLVIDPMLLDELDRMTRGYRVLARPERPQPPLTAELVAADSRPGTVAGNGAAAAADFLARVKSLAVGRPVIVLPYGDPDVVALTRSGMTSQVARAVYRGRAVAARLLPDAQLVTTVAVPPAGLVNDTTLALLASLDYRSIVLSPDTVGGAAAGSLLTLPVPGRAPMTGIVTGGGFTDGLPGTLGGLVDADTATSLDPARMLLALAAQQLTAPDRTGAGSPMVLSPARSLRADRAGTATLGRTLADFTRAGLIRPGGPATDFGARTGPVEAELDYPDSARRVELPRSHLSTVRELDAMLTTLGRTVTLDPNGPGNDPADLLAPLADGLLGAVSAAHRGHIARAELVTTTVAESIDAVVAGVDIVRSGGSYTLASATAPLLLTVQNLLPYRVTVGIEILGGAQAGLTTVDSGPIVLDAGPRTGAVRIESTVSRSGTFTVQARLTAADGSAWGPPAPITIDSRAYGALTLILMIVAGGLLLVMVALRLRQRWRERGDTS